MIVYPELAAIAMMINDNDQYICQVSASDAELRKVLLTQVDKVITPSFPNMVKAIKTVDWRGRAKMTAIVRASMNVDIVDLSQYFTDIIFSIPKEEVVDVPGFSPTKIVHTFHREVWRLRKGFKGKPRIIRPVAFMMEQIRL